MRILKNHPFLQLGNDYLIDASQPTNISYMWNFGSLLALCLGIQIVTGVTLAMHYNPSALEAFNSVEHIMRDVNNGWLIRYLHSNTASAFFFLVYLHIGRGMYYGSYRAPRTLVWTVGTVILILMIAIAFLGYYNSPIWSNIFNNLYFFCLNLIICIITATFTISFILLYLDDWSLSNIYIIRYIQMISFVGIIIIILIKTHNYMLTDVICNINDNDINLHGHGHVSIDKEAGKAIGKGLSTVGGQIGLGATMVGVSGAIGKAIAKSSMPPVQKAGIIVGGALIGGLGHSMITSINRNSIAAEHGTSVSSSDIGSQASNLVSGGQSPLQEILFDIYNINAVCLSLIVILVIQIIFKINLNKHVKMDFSHVLGSNLNNTIEYYLNKVIVYNSKMSVIYIWLILILLVIGLSFSIYGSYELYSNIDSYIDVHLVNNKNN